MKFGIKFGFFLIGTGVGIFVSTLWYQHELDKPIGEIEEYIPKNENDSETEAEDSDNSNNSQDDDISSERESDSGDAAHSEFDSGESDILNFYKRYEKTNKDKVVNELPNTQHTKIRYNKMFESNVNVDTSSKDVTDILHEVSSRGRTHDSFSEYTDHTEDDYLFDDYDPEKDLHEEYKLEKTSDGFEIFLDDNPQDFATLIFYNEDHILCDDQDQIIPNPEEVVGMVALSRLIEGGPGAQNDVIFVHNAKSCVNYEVVLDAGSYKETVAGIFDSTRERTKRPKIE